MIEDTIFDSTNKQTCKKQLTIIAPTTQFLLLAQRTIS